MKSLCFAFALCLALPAVADPFPVTVTDGRGSEVTILSQPNRVAALWPPAADLLVSLDRPVTGVTTYEGRMPVYLGGGVDGAIDLGDITTPNLELLSVSDIDLTVGMTRYNAPFADQIEPISPFLTFEGYSIAESLAAIETLAEALGAGDTARAMNRDFLELANTFAARAPATARSVLFIWSFQDTLYGYQDNLMTTALVARLGTVNPLGLNDDTQNPDNAFVILEAEDLLKHDPDVILMFLSHGGAAKFNPAYARLKAYQNNDIYRVGYQYSQPAGPIAREMVLREAAHLIYPDTFARPAMPEAARATPVEFAK